eukprot:m.121551 g.121551  ORF g.121551 m.121551 type:complete len:84 (+) comp37754_c0_seq6:39-290(+)
MGYTPFLRAVHSGQADILDLLLAKKCNVHAKDESKTGALSFAGAKGYVKILKRLVKHGLDVFEVNKVLIFELINKPHGSVHFN